MKKLKTLGFTLIEILIVMLIITIVGGLSLMTMGKNHARELKAFSQSLRTVLKFAEEEAILNDETYRLSLHENHFQFALLTTQENKLKWFSSTRAPFSQLIVPEGIHLSQLKNETQDVSLIFFASGDIQPFTLYLGLAAQLPIYQLVGARNGEITLSEIKHEA